MSDPSFAIETPRLRLVYFQHEDDADCDFLVELYNTPEFLASMGGKPTAIITREAARERLAGRFRDEHARNRYGTYLILLRTADGRRERVGTVSLLGGGGGDNLLAPDLGFAVLSRYMRQGYASEAARALLDYVERELGLKAVFGFTDSNNEASRGVFRKLGFNYRGEAPIRVFNGDVVPVFTKPGMEEDLAVYGV